MLESICEVSVAVGSLKKRPAKGETPVKMSEPEQKEVPLAPVVLLVPPAVGRYVIPPSGMPAPMPILGGATSDQDEEIRLRQFVIGESSGAHESGAQHCERWDVGHFLNNGGQLFYGSTDLEVAIDWFDTADGVLEHMGCPPEL